jgi:hypothetical protein
MRCRPNRDWRDVPGRQRPDSGLPIDRRSRSTARLLRQGRAVRHRGKASGFESRYREIHRFDRCGRRADERAAEEYLSRLPAPRLPNGSRLEPSIHHSLGVARPRRPGTDIRGTDDFAIEFRRDRQPAPDSGAPPLSGKKHRVSFWDRSGFRWVSMVRPVQGRSRCRSDHRTPDMPPVGEAIGMAGAAQRRGHSPAIFENRK